ncbi:MAG: ParA family protein [Planctomycetaceae bacterium]|nr:ParA family protein [Planctomycetaceae bacterium]
MVRTFCIANRKGGVGKTTTAISLADGLAKAGARTLLVDIDPQCHAGSGLGIEPVKQHALVHGLPFTECIQKTGNPLLYVLPGSRNFGDVEMLIQTGNEEKEQILTQLQTEFELYDFVLVDCPPSLGELTQLALAASTDVLIPIQCEYFAMEGFVRMIEVIKKIMNQKPEKLQFGGVLLTMHDAALELTFEVEKQIRDFFGGIVFETNIPRDVALGEAPSHGKSIIDYAPRSRGARSYVELCMEVLERG